MPLIDILAEGGWLMAPIALCSVIAIAIIVEKFVTLRKARISTGHFLLQLKNAILKGHMDEALNLCSNTPGPVAKVLHKGIEKAHRDKKEMQETIQNAGKEEVYYLERHLAILATIAGVAPLIGFLGTVTGMIQAFMEIQRLGGNVNSTVLAGGIWEALITTAAGLTVGIIAFVFYNYLVTKIQKLVFEMESSSNEILELIYSEMQNEFQD